MKRNSIIFSVAVAALGARARLIPAALMMLALAFLFGGWWTPGAATQSPAQRQALIQRNGKIAGGPAYRSMVEAKYGISLRSTRGNLIAANGSSGSSVVQVGGEPQGFGKGFQWDRQDDKILLAVFLNAADDLGVSIAGVERSDTIQISSAAGVASFSEDKGNPLASSIVGLVAVGGKAVLGATGNGEFIPIVNAAESFAKDQFKATNAKTKRRNAFGVDPGSGHKAKQEGGIIVSLPEAGGPYYSGESTNRWIKPDGTRNDTNLPIHIPFGTAFFPMQGFNSHNTRTITTGGEIYVLPWDWKFDDNAGYYKVFILIQKGPPLQDGPIFRRIPRP